MARDDGAAQEQEQGFGLADLVDAVRRDLQVAEARGRNETLTFRVDQVQLEITVQVQRQRTGKGGVKVWVVEAGGELQRTDASLQRVTLTLATTRDVVIAEEGEGR